MLKQVLAELENATQPLSLSELSQRLQIEPSALAGMLDFWVRKGRLQVLESGDETSICPPDMCGGSCGGPQDCPFTVNLPRSYALRPKV